MAVPDYQSIMLPLLKLANDGREHKVTEVIVPLAQEFNLSDDDVREMVPSGVMGKFKNRISWARTYLKKAGLLFDPLRGYFQITEAGKKLLLDPPQKITVLYLGKYDSFQEFRNIRKEKVSPKDVTEEMTITPTEQIESGYSLLREELVGELLEKIKSGTPRFFEELVIDLLVKMGYGGNRKDAGEAIGRPHDGGIDGIIKEDKLGLDVIYVQAKKWENTVGRPQVQAFAGSLDGVRAKRGIFITTSHFSKDAQEYVKNIEKRIVLIDADLLAELMIDNNLGVSIVTNYEVKKLDTDYFEED